MTTIETMGQRIHDLCVEKEITHKEIAEYCNKNNYKCSEATISNIVNGVDKGVDYRTIIGISKCLGVSIDYIVGNSNVETSDKDIQFIGDYTGLELDTINVLHQENNNTYYPYLVDFVNFFFTSDFFDNLQYNLYWFDFENAEIFDRLRGYQNDCKYYCSLPTNKNTLTVLTKLFINLSTIFRDNIDEKTMKKYVIVKKFEKLLDDFLFQYEATAKELVTRIDYYYKNAHNLSIEDIEDMQALVKDIEQFIIKKNGDSE